MMNNCVKIKVEAKGIISTFSPLTDFNIRGVEMAKSSLPNDFSLFNFYQCIRCFKESRIAFPRNGRVCLDCINTRRRLRYANLSDDERLRHNAICRENRLRKLDSRRASAREYAKSHQSENSERSRKWRLNRPDHVSHAKKAYHLANAEKIREKVRQWRTENKARKNATNSKRRAVQRNAAGSTYTTAVYIAWRWQMWGGRCWVCGDIAEATDHVIPLNDGGSHWPSNLRPICKSCNSKRPKTWAKAKIETRSCPRSPSSGSKAISTADTLTIFTRRSIHAPMYAVPA